MKRKRGFTFAELLIVIAIITVLVGIAIPILFNQLERSRQAVDLSTMRHAYTITSLELMTGNIQNNSVYFYNGAALVDSANGIKGYGKAKTDASVFAQNFPVDSAGIPNRNGNPGYLTIKINADDTMRFMWGGAYAGLNVMSAEEYNNLSNSEKLKKDVILIDSLQDDLRNMTYGELQQLYKSGMPKGAMNGKLCLTLAYGTIDSSGNTVSGDKRTHIYVNDIFNRVGFDTGLDSSQTYIINSVSGKTNTIWVNLGISENELKNMKESDSKWNQKAVNAYTYVKSDGAITPEELREINRRK